jgi:hypothetical protein
VNQASLQRFKILPFGTHHMPHIVAFTMACIFIVVLKIEDRNLILESAFTQLSQQIFLEGSKQRFVKRYMVLGIQQPSLV